MQRELIRKILGIFLIILGAGALLTLNRWQYMFWFCNHAAIIMGIALLTKNKFWLHAELNIALLPQLMWTVDFLSYLLFKTYVFNITEYMFAGFAWHNVFSMQHMLVPFLGLYALFLLKGPVKNAWKGTLLHGLLLWPISYFLITPDYNINCVHTPCVNFFNATPAYPFIWPVIFYIIVVAITHIALMRAWNYRTHRR